MPNLIQVLLDIQHNPAVRQQAVMPTGLDPLLARLREWQSQRLRRTYSDLLASSQYALAGRFLLEDIYAVRDFSQRDHDFERLHELLARFLPPHMLRTLKGAIQLNRMTHQLDRQLLCALTEELGVLETITPEAYAQGYRICDNYAERRQQIELTAALLEEVIAGARFPLTGVTLRLARRPAYSAGWQELFGFLARGYAAAQPVRDLRYFVNTIRQREMEILDDIFAGDIVSNKNLTG
jgi:hypothetical protein